MSATRPAAPEALLVILQRLSPAERLAFVLHDMLDRVRRRVRSKTPDPTSDLVPASAHRRIPDRGRDGDFASLLDALHTDVVLRFGVVGDKITDIDIEATRPPAWPQVGRP